MAEPDAKKKHDGKLEESDKDKLLEEIKKIAFELSNKPDYDGSIIDVDKVATSAILMTKIEQYIYTPGTEEGILNIIFGDRKFYLYFKSFHNQYDIAILKSVLVADSVKEEDSQMIVLYKSSSQGLWRLAIQGLKGVNEYYEKLTDYVQSTLIHMELQLFLEQHFYNPENVASQKIIRIPLDNLPGTILANYGILKLPGLKLLGTASKSTYQVFNEYITPYIQNLGEYYNYLVKQHERIHTELEQYQRQVMAKKITRDFKREKSLIDEKSQVAHDIENFYAYRSEKGSESIDELKHKFLKNDEDILTKYLDTDRIYSGEGSYIFSLLNLIDYIYLSDPLNFFVVYQDESRQLPKLTVSDSYTNFIQDINIIMEGYPEPEFPELHSILVNIKTNFEGLLAKIFKQPETLTEYEILENLIWGVNSLLRGVFDVEKPDERKLTMTSKKLKKTIVYAGRWKTPFRKRRTLEASRNQGAAAMNDYDLGSASNSDTPDDPTSNTFTLINDLQITRYILKIKPSMPGAGQLFILYYGQFNKGKKNDKKYNFPICVYPEKCNVSKWGLPDKYIKTGLYSGKPYDYINQVCKNPQKIQYVRINPQHIYLFCGDIYNKFWPGNIGQSGGQVLKPRALGIKYKTFRKNDNRKKFSGTKKNKVGTISSKCLLTL